MAEKENPLVAPEIPLRPENLPKARLYVAHLRETKATQEEALREARKWRKASIEWEKHEDVVDWYWEEYLIGKHFVMRARDERSLNRIQKSYFALRGLAMMRSMALEAHAYINRNSVETKRTRSHRFVGEVSMLSKDYRKAIEHFRPAIESFNQMDDPIERTNALELSGFLAEALILSGQTQEGLRLARKTFVAYDSGDGALRKEQDYYTWAVWKSGCVTKVWNAILNKRVPLEDSTRSELIEMLNKADKITFFANGETTWGDLSFEMRKDEIASIRGRIGQI